MGRDCFPIVMRLRELETLKFEDMASINQKCILKSYTDNELRKEFRKLTGHVGTDILEAAQNDDTHDEVKAAVHCAVLQANPSVGQRPRIQRGTSHVFQTPKVADVFSGYLDYSMVIIIFNCFQPVGFIVSCQWALLCGVLFVSYASGNSCVE